MADHDQRAGFAGNTHHTLLDALEEDAEEHLAAGRVIQAANARAAIANLRTIPPWNEVEEPEDQCSICGVNESETTGWTGLIDVRVAMAWGEEGAADITMLLCSDHFPHIRASLLILGFGDHRHGGINFLEATWCPGANGGVCPTPQEDEDGDNNGSIMVKPRPPV